MLLLHDVPETASATSRRYGKKYLKIRGEVDIAGDQVADLPEPLRTLFHELALDFRARDSLEARIAKSADRLECLTQAKEYAALGYHGANSWIESTLETIETPAAREIAERMAQRDPTTWWRRFV